MVGIAGQTNLLALNASIEAAHTSDALEVSTTMNTQAQSIKNISNQISGLSSLASMLDLKMKDIRL